MTKLKLLHLKNEMLLANTLANLIGAVLVQALLFKAETPFPQDLFTNRLVYLFDLVFTPLAFIIVIVFTLIYERPIRLYLTAKENPQPISPDLEGGARRRLLNEPFVLIAIDFRILIKSDPLIH